VLFWNKVYEGALGWTSELTKFGAQAVTCDPHRVVTFGGRPLAPATVESPYIIRVAIALLMIAASIPGRSVIVNAEPIARAHPRFVENLCALGADVAWEEAA
jgi:UDP-N-acetylglucosamine 1-carboxyvinyltransferase